MSVNPAPSTPAVVAIICGIWNDGYHVVKEFLTQDEVSAVRRAVDGLSEAKWFRETGIAHRRQAPLSLADNINAPPPAFRFVHERMVDFAGRLHHSWTVTTKWDVVELSPGWPPQHLHRDFVSTETAATIEAHEWVQASVLLALTDGPKVITVPEAFNRCAIRSNAYVIEMNAGDLLIFRGDLPHADPRAEAHDVRLQGTLLVDNVAHDATVERVAWGFYRCRFCFKRSDSKRSLTNHQRYCDSNPEKEAIARKWKANNDKGAFCKKCQRHFGIKTRTTCTNAEGRSR